MSTGKTEFLGLNLWELQDDFNHLEFNADNEKIDAAFLQLANLKVAWGSYEGAGAWGAEVPTTLNVGFTPKCVLIATQSFKWGRNIYSPNGIEGDPLFFAMCDTTSVPIMKYGSDNSSYGTTELRLNWNEDSVSWYVVDNGYGRGPEQQFNAAGTTYHYLVIGERGDEA